MSSPSNGGGWGDDGAKSCNCVDKTCETAAIRNSEGVLESLHIYQLDIICNHHITAIRISNVVSKISSKNKLEKLSRATTRVE